MIAFTSILVDIDALASDHPALREAVRVAASCGAKLKIVDVLHSVPPSARHFVTGKLESEIIEHRKARLQAAASAIKDVPVTAELLRGRPAHALIQEVVRSGHDLLVRSHGRDLAARSRPFGAIDMELLRQCPCPVWLISGHGLAHAPWRVVAAVHANPDDATEQALNAAILELALMLKDTAGAELTVVQAWTAFGAGFLKSQLSRDEVSGFLEAARQSEQEALAALAEPFEKRMQGVAVELIEGEPEDVISEFVDSNGIDVVVMGTVARTGISGVIMGNTAERVLQRLRGSVLAVKPPGFESLIAKKNP